VFCIIFDTKGINGPYSPQEGKNAFHSEAQTEQQYAIWCSCWYLYGLKV